MVTDLPGLGDTHLDFGLIDHPMATMFGNHHDARGEFAALTRVKYIRIYRLFHVSWYLASAADDEEREQATAG